MAGFDIIQVPPRDRRLLERFIRMPWLVHRRIAPNPYWVPPLLQDRRDFLHPDKNPFFEHADYALWLVQRDGVDVGRILAVRDAHYVATAGEDVGFFGMFECADDPEAARALIDRAAAWLAARGCTRMIGPIDLAVHLGCGVLLDAFDREPGMAMPYNPPYYDPMLRDCGLAKDRDLYHWSIDVRTPVPERIVRIAERTARRHRVTVRRQNFRNWNREIALTRRVYSEAWKDNWGFAPQTEKEFRHQAGDLKLLLHPDLTLIAEIDDEPVAIAYSIVNINALLRRLDGRLLPTGLLRLLWALKVRRRFDGGRLIMLGIREQYRDRGFDTLLFLETFKAAVAQGWTVNEIGWTLEENERVNRAIAVMNGSLTHTYRIYTLDLPAATSSANASSSPATS